MGTTATLELNNKRVLDLEQLQSGYEDAFALKVEVNIDSQDRAQVNTYVDDLLLAVNLNLKRGILLRIAIPWQNNSGSYGISRTGSLSIDERKKSYTSNIPYPPMAPEPYEENINEDKIMYTLKLIQSTDIHMLEFSDDLRKTNIKLALIEFETAMSSFMYYTRFKHLFDSLEILANYDVTKKDNFDIYLSQQTRIDSTKIANWRKLYNRLKHAAETVEDIHTMVTFATNLSRNEELLEIRQAASALVEERIKETYTVV